MNKVKLMVKKVTTKLKCNTRNLLKHCHPGIDGILVTVGLCIIALVLCVLMKDKLAVFITTIVTEMTNKASSVLKMNG